MKESEISLGMSKVPEPIKNSVIIGLHAGRDLVEADYVFIMGDGITNLDKDQKDVIFLSAKVAIGKYVFGQESELYKALQ